MTVAPPKSRENRYLVVPVDPPAFTTTAKVPLLVLDNTKCMAWPPIAPPLTTKWTTLVAEGVGVGKSDGQSLVVVNTVEWMV
jgi:hypothetical protein